MDDPTCACGNSIEPNAGRGRPRKRCATCSAAKAYTPRPLRTIECAVCSTRFQGNGNAKYCTETCANRAKHLRRERVPCRVCGKPTSWYTADKNAPAAPKHQDCMPEHGLTRYKRGCRCETCREATRSDHAAYWARRRTLNPDHLRCTAPGCDATRKGRTLCTKHLKRAMRADGTLKPSPSEDWRTPKRTALLIQRRAIVRGATGPADRFTVHDLIARDGNTCGICGEPIEGTRYPHPMSASIDHIIPISRGGTHTLTNARPTHLRCNIARGNRD